jgi:hypothetical protein
MGKILWTFMGEWMNSTACPGGAVGENKFALDVK